MKNQSNELQPSANLDSLQTVPKSHPFFEFKEKAIRARVIVMEVGKVDHSLGGVQTTWPKAI